MSCPDNSVPIGRAIVDSLLTSSVVIMLSAESDRSAPLSISILDIYEPSRF